MPGTSIKEPTKELEVFPNPTPGRDYLIHMDIPEFTCLCPKTGQPDFATLILDYIPDKKCVELKSLKLYIWSYRNEGAFHEAVTNRIELGKKFLFKLAYLFRVCPERRFCHFGVDQLSLDPHHAR